MAQRIPIGVVLLLLGVVTTAGALFGAFLLLRPDWLGLGSPKATPPAASDTLALDSLAPPSPWDELYAQLQQLLLRETRLRDSLQLLRHRADSLQAENEHLRQELQQWQQRWQKSLDSMRVHHYEAFAKIYNSAAPEQVARILEQLPAPEAAMILKRMTPRQAARVIAALPPRHAAAALTAGETTLR